jgi:hypothetical protein
MNNSVDRIGMASLAHQSGGVSFRPQKLQRRVDMRSTRFGISVLTLVLLASSITNAVAVTELSGKASTLRSGMTRYAVVRLLGSPTWATIPGDDGDFAIPDPRIALELFWHNPGCNPVVVDFDHNLRVIGWDEGRAYCGTNAHLLEPSDKYSCNKPDRAKFCK